MMGLFGRTKYDAKAEKLRLIHRIEQLQDRMAANGLQKAMLELDKAADILDDKYLTLRKEQAEFINTFISDIDAHLSKQYETLILKKCERIISMARGECPLDEQSVTRAGNEDRLFEMLGELDHIDAQIKTVDKRMDAALGTDKNLWNMLNAQRHTLTSRMMVISKNYQTLLESQNAISVAAEVKRARCEAESIIRQSGMQDVIDFEDNAEFTTMAADDIRENSVKMQEVFDRTFGGAIDSYEYERALEQKLMEKDTATPCEHSEAESDKPSQRRKTRKEE